MSGDDLKFGTSGLRGLVNAMTDPVCEAWAAAFVAHLSTDMPRPAIVLVGHDLRPSSPRIAAACRRAVCRAGLDAVDCGVLPTPALALEAARQQMPAIMVTGSHIPFDRNGLKFYRPAGEITKADEAGIRAAYGTAAGSADAPAGSELIEAGARERYLARGRILLAPETLAGWRIGVWQHSAAGRDLIVTALETLGATTVPLGRTDDFVPIDTEAIAAEDAARIAGWIGAHRLDALVSTDGDGDRPLLADDTGRILRGDLLGLLTARALGADGVATPISSNTALERSGWVQHVVRTRIGSPFVIEGMAALAAKGARLPVGYEANGGFLLGGSVRGPDGGVLAPLPTRDALLPLLTVLAAAATRGVSLSRLVDETPARFTASDRLERVPAASSGPLLKRLATDPACQRALLEALDRQAVVRIETLDGVRLTLDGDEIAHLRASGNAPELRAYAEAGSAARAEAMVAALLQGAARLMAV